MKPATAKSTLTPKLRFPEFRGAEGWKADDLGEVADFVNEKITLERVSLENYVSTENILPDYGGVDRASKLPTTGSVTRFRTNDTLVSNIRPYLKKVLVADKEGGVSNDVIVIRAKQRLLPEYFSFLLKNDAFIDYVMTGAKGVKMPRGDIGSMKEYPALYPSKPEQQKIAECLSSVDELIAAQARKVDALKTHKKGLMQELFPREGETRPRLRFAEFQHSGEWEQRTAGSLFANRVTKGEAGLPMYSVTMHDGMVKRASFDRNFYDIEDAAGNKKACRNDIAYNMMRMWQGAFGVAPEDCLVSPAYIVLAPTKDAIPEFFKYLFKLPATLVLLTSHSRGLTKDRLRLYYDDFSRIPLQCPPLSEQQRIADCLSSLDALITTETQKLEALKTHKKGLMQQLFPKTNASQNLSVKTAIAVHVATASEKTEPVAAPSAEPYKVGFARQLLAAEILQHCHQHPTMGRVKLQKLIHLCEYLAELDDIHGNYVRAAAGPFDNKLMRGVANGLEKQKWFKQVRGEKRVTYEPMILSGQHSKYLQRWSKQLPRMHEVIKCFAAAKTLSCEIASTLYAAWNDLLIEGRQPADEEIIREASDPKRWHESKANIDEIKWPTALKWMREKGFAPRGYGAHTTRRTNLHEAKNPDLRASAAAMQRTAIQTDTDLVIAKGEKLSLIPSQVLRAEIANGEGKAS